MICGNCGVEVPDDGKFCIECGAAQDLRCPACATPYEQGQKFCGECGSRLTAEQAPAEPAVPELRLVSVLFVDIVSYTTLSESRDPEDVRELLGRYFDDARAIIERHGGTLEKFIGDAVMAVWGAPVAREDDAERAVRAGLELVDAVSALGVEIGVPALQARAGIVTGQAASMNRPGEGLVVGDRVNTAARTQSAAEPGTVFVDGVTREATSLAIAYEDAGEHTVKGKSMPLHLWRAVRVLAGVKGAQRDRGLEPPLVGREEDLRLLKDIFHGAIERGAARLVAISGDAGVGKSRVLWEFDKYVDARAETVLWHSGGCLSYGEGIAYWALADMVRQRLGIAQDAPIETVARRLHEGLERWVRDPADREFLAPRLGVLLGLAEREMPRAELFAGWRMFFERLAETAPVALVFEDLQWADEGLLAFIEYLLDWAQSSPIFILTLARHELAARPDGWPPVRRGATLLRLDPLSAADMGQLLDALVDGLDRRVRAQVIERAEGVPLYAMETLRVLASRGQLLEREGRLVAVGEMGELDVPATLGSLIAARLDALAPAEQRLVRAMCVFGGSFPNAAAAALGGLTPQELEVALASLVRKQVLSISADPLSPQRGQYSFSQELLRTVAYDRLSRRERKPRHRAAADYLRRTFPNDGEEVTEVLASHYLDAYRAAREDEDAPELRAQAITALHRAALRATSVGAPATAERAYRSASELAEGEERLQLTSAAGEMALQAGNIERALELFGTAAQEVAGSGRRREMASVAACLGETLHRLERNEEATRTVERALAALAGGPPVPEEATLNAILGRARVYGGDAGGAEEPLAHALDLARRDGLPAVESRVLTDQAMICEQRPDPRSARTLLLQAIEIAGREDLREELILARGNLATLGSQWDLPEAADQHAEVLALARRSGDRLRESIAVANLCISYLLAGRWDEAEALTHGVLGDLEERPGSEFIYAPLTILHALRGRREAARATLAHLDGWGHGDDEELQAMHAAVAVVVALAGDEPETALARGEEMTRTARATLTATHEAFRIGWPDTVEAALRLGRPQAAGALLALVADGLPAAARPPYLAAQLERLQALVEGAGADPDELSVEKGLQAAADGFRALSYPYWAARCELELGGWLLAHGDAAQGEAQLASASATFEQLGAAPALARLALARAESGSPQARVAHPGHSRPA